MQKNSGSAPANMPVYLFTGFLESGKTKFIQETLSDKRFNRGEKTLVLVCEEGETEYDLSAFKRGNVELRVVENEEDLTTEYLKKLERELKFERVMVEYNGMWMLDTLYRTMPEGWVIYQEFMFADYRTFLSYNTNMRQLVYDKLSSCDIVVFNRTPRPTDMEGFHKIIRAANRNCDIAYEHPDGSVEYDQIEDPLPFDISAPVIEIGDRDYALWYRDLGEELDTYNGKTVRFKCQVSISDELPSGCIIVGRPIMNCCAADVSFAGLVVENVPNVKEFSELNWVMLKAKITVKRHKAYDRKGPVLSIIGIGPTEPPEEPVATFY